MLDDLKECFEYRTPARPHLRATMKIRGLEADFGRWALVRGEEDRILFEGMAGKTRSGMGTYFSPLPEELPEAVHEVYVQLRYDGMDQEAARRTALAVLA